MMRELRVEDALLYLDQVKVEFGDRPHIYNEFLDIMKTFKTQQIDTPGVIRRVSNLFQGNRRLVLGFNTFLPEGYKIEIPSDGDGPPVAVYRAPGSNVAHILRESAESQAVSVAAAAAAANQQQQQQQQYHPGGMAPRNNLASPSQQQQPQPPPDHLVYGANRGSPPNRLQPQHQSMQPQQQSMQPQQQQSMQQQLQQQPPMQQQTAKSLLPHDAGGVAPRGALTRPMESLQQQRQHQHHVQQLPGGVTPRLPKPPIDNLRPIVAGLQQQHSPMLQQPPNGTSPPQQVGGNGASVLGGLAGSFGGADASAGGQPLEFDHAINYVTTIKRRFAAEPETYKKFLEILHTYQKEQRGIKEVLDEVSDLFEDHPDLLKEFTFFLPDAVQAAAKMQLDQVAKEAEARKHLKAKAAIMNTAQGMQRQAQTVRQKLPHEIHNDRMAAPSGGPYPQPPPARSSAERENNISKGAQYGTVIFDPVRPPLKHEPTPAAAALKNVRPAAVPELPMIPSTVEDAFFTRAKEHLNRKELAADKPVGSRRHTPYTEFLKCLHLFAAGILTKDELIMLLKGLFLQGHAPKSGANATGGNHNPTVAYDANELMREFEVLLVHRGPYADQQTALKDKSKYGSMRIRDFDFGHSQRVTPSYRPYPSDYPHALFFGHPCQSPMDESVRNNELACVDINIGMDESESSGTRAGGSKHRKRKAAPSIEESDASKKRHNIYEEAMLRIEDDRYELDMAIERNVHALRRIEPFAKEAQAFREQEEKDGQPIGRLRYQLHRYSLNSIHISAIGRIYGDRGDEIVQHLLRNPLIVLPIVYQRLKQKDTEWRKAKAELVDKWNAICEANYEGVMDVQCYFNRKALEKSFTSSRLLEQCKRARSFVKHPERIKDHPASRPFTPTFGTRAPHAGALLYQPYLEVQCKVDISHKHAMQLIVHTMKVASNVTALDRERMGRIWAEFVVPWFQYPSHWVLDEVRDSFRGKLCPSVTKCTLVCIARGLNATNPCLPCRSLTDVSRALSLFSIPVASGQRVRTIFGEGTIASFMDVSGHVGPRYRVKLPFGLAHLSPSAILYAVPSVDAPHIRRDGIMVREEAALYAKEGSARLDARYQLLFGTEKIYQFLRLYLLLCSLLSDTREHCASVPPRADPADSYVNPGSATRTASRAGDFSTLLAAIRRVVAGDTSGRAFEALARAVSRDKVHQIAALPALTERCLEALVKVAEEDALLHLYDFRQDRSVDPVAVRSLCLAVVPDAYYRIQYDREAGTVRCCYLEGGCPLLTAPPRVEEEEEEDDDDDDGAEIMEVGARMDTGDDAVDDDDAVMEGAAAEEERTASPEAKRARLAAVEVEEDDEEE